MFFFESVIQQILKSELSGSESLVEDYRSGDYVFDFFLPAGCQRLGFSPKTAIEIKTRLVSGTVAEGVRRARTAIKIGDIHEVVLIYQEVESEKTSLIDKPHDGIRFLSIKQLEEGTGLNHQRIVQQGKESNNWARDRDALLKDASARFRQGSVSLFLGSGLGKSAGLPDWNELIKRVVDEVNEYGSSLEKHYYAVLDSDSGHSPIIISRYLKDALKDDSSDFVPIIWRALYKKPPKSSKLVNAVKQMCLSTCVQQVISYNYDDLLEQAIGDERRYSSIDGRNRPSPGFLPIYHVHGFVPRDDDPSYHQNVVLSEDEYHLLYKESFHWSNAEQIHALRNTTCFFIGLSLLDPNLRRLLDISNQIGTKDPPHFAFLKRGDFNQPEKAEHLFYSMGVKILWFEDFEEVPKMILMLVSNANGS